ncbi:MAG: PIN domain-containing protein [Bradymonadaceae bacterium]
MIALDTNVLVRYLVEDGPAEQCRRAAELVDRAVDEGRDLFISDVVACETVWVLESAYDVGRDDVASVLDRLLETRQIRFRHAALICRAVDSYESGTGDFADYVTRELAHEQSCDEVATFDTELLEEKDFVAP